MLLTIRDACVRFMQRALDKKTLARLCAVWLVIMLVLLGAMCFFCRPTHDDFPHTAAAAEAWARTGSVTATLRAAWAHTVDMYLTWQGTFVAMFMSSFTPMVFDVEFFWITPLVTLAALCAAAAYLVAQTRRLLGLERTDALIAYTVFLTLVLAFMPGMREAVYWQSGTPSTWGFTFMLLYAALMMHLHNAARKHGDCLCAASAVCGILAGGCPYPLALAAATGAILLCLWCFIRRSPAKVGSVIGAVATTASLLAVVLAPGNAVRQTRVGYSVSPVVAVIQSVAECLQTTGEWASPQLLAAAVLLMPLLWGPLRQSHIRFRMPLLLTVLCMGVMAAAFVPPVYATGVDSYRIDRIIASLHMLFIALFMLCLLCWTGWLAQRSEKPANHHIPLWRLALCLTLVVWGLFSCAIMATPCVSSAHALITGQAVQYRDRLMERETALAAAQTPEAMRDAITPIGVEPAVLPADTLIHQRSTSLPALMHRFYRMQQLTETHGAGRIPANEWDALN